MRHCATCSYGGRFAHADPTGPTKRQQAWLLHFGDGLSVSEVASALNLAQDVARQYVSGTTAEIAMAAQRRWGSAGFRHRSAVMRGGVTFGEVLAGGGACESDDRNVAARAYTVTAKKLHVSPY